MLVLPRPVGFFLARACRPPSSWCGILVAHGTRFTTQGENLRPDHPPDWGHSPLPLFRLRSLPLPGLFDFPRCPADPAARVIPIAHVFFSPFFQGFRVFPFPFYCDGEICRLCTPTDWSYFSLDCVFDRGCSFRPLLAETHGFCFCLGFIDLREGDCRWVRKTASGDSQRGAFAFGHLGS